MNQIDIDFLNLDLIRYMQNCYTYALGSHYGFGFSSWCSPGATRSVNNHKPPNIDQFYANIIIDGLIPLYDPWKDDKNNFSIPTAPPGYYVVKVYVVCDKEDRERDYSFEKIDSVSTETLDISYRAFLFHDPTKQSADAAKIRFETEQLSQIRYLNYSGFGFIGFFAVPDAGINTSPQKVISDIYDFNPKLLNKMETKFIDAGLEFYNQTKNLQRNNFNTQEQADSAAKQYHLIFKNYSLAMHNFKFNKNLDKLNRAYQKTPMAEQDRKRVFDLWAANLTKAQQKILKRKKIY